MKPFKDAEYRVRLHRSQNFLPEERTLVGLFIQEVANIQSQSDQDYFGDLIVLLPRRVIGKLLGDGVQGRKTLEDAIQWFESLASQTYEGKQIVAALGITGSVSHGKVTINELAKGEDFAKVLSNGFDTMYVCGKDGRVFNLRCLKIGNFVPKSLYRMDGITNWCTNKRVAIVLNRNGEILVFKNKLLQFSKRGGKWRYYPHESTLQRLGIGLRREIKNAIYDSCLDVSFARTGGCIALLTRDGEREINKKKFVNSDDWIENPKKIRTKLLNSAVKKPFQNLDRRLRQELLAMDGAIILSHTGALLTAGSIIKVPGGSSGGGGREAAARNLSKLGLGIKISADGPITGFKKKREIFSI